MEGIVVVVLTADCHIMKKIFKITKYFTRIIKILSSAGKMHLIIIVLMAIFFGIMPSISIRIMQEITNVLQTKNQSLNYIFIFIAMYISIDFFIAIAGMISEYVESVLLMKASLTLSMSVIEKVKEFSLKDLENSETYDLIQRANNISIGQLFSFFKSFVNVFQSIINLVMFSLILMSFRWWLIPIIFIMPIINTSVAAFFGKKQFLIIKDRTGKERKMNYFKYLLTNDIAYKEIKIFNISDYFCSRFKQLSLEIRKQDRKLLNQRTVAQSGILILDQIISGILFAYVIITTFVGDTLLGDMITYTRSISNVRSSVQGVLSQINSIYQNTLNISLYFDLIDMKTVAVKCDNLLPLSEIQSIDIKNLSYRYKNKNEYALRNINLRVEKGSMIALIGQNGSGKTTFVKILSTLYNDYEGDVYFGNYNLRDINTEDVRNKIGLLFQDYVNYQLLVKENIALGQIEKIDDHSAIMQALSKTEMQDKFVDLNTQLGFWFENGIQLSGGEWLKMALSRAFIRDAELYLLDEPNAALDAISERQILDSFKKLCEGKIGIIISHRIASIKDIVDKIVVFDEGIIKAEGTHDELLNNSDIYRKLYNNEEGID